MNKVIILLLLAVGTIFCKEDSLFTKLNSLNAIEKLNALDNLYYDAFVIDPPTAVRFAQEKIKLVETHNLDDSIKAFGYINLGYAYLKLSSNDSSYANFITALDLFEKNDMKRETAIVYANLGMLFNSKGEFEKAYQYIMNELSVLEEFSDSSFMAGCYLRLATTLDAMGKSEESLSYYEKAIEFGTKYDDKVILANANNNIGVVYELRKEWDKALEYYYKSLEINIEMNSELGIEYSKFNIAEISKQKGEYDKALNIFLQSDQFFEEQGLKLETIYSSRSIAFIYSKQKKFSAALKYINKAIKLSEEIGSTVELRDNYKQLAKIYEEKNDFRNAHKYHQVYVEYKDSVLNATNIEKINELQTKYETEQKEKENELLRSKLEFNEKVNTFYLIIVILVILLVIFTIYWLVKIHNKNKKLNELNATKDKFFSIIAHDLKNPFSVLMGFSEMLLESFRENTEEENLESISALHESSKRGYKLLENLLDWSRSQRGKIDFRPVKLNIKEVSENIIQLLEMTAKKKNISLTSKVDENIFANADMNMVSTTIRNITSNALKFTNPGGYVEIDAEYKSDRVEVRVIDNGIGIEKDDLKKLFRIDVHHSTAGTASESGTGLGLIICKEFIEKNSGTINVESTPGEGTQFHIQLPKSN